MADNLSIILGAKLDNSQRSITDLNTQISKLSAKLNKLDLKINIDTKGLTQAFTQLTQTQQKLQGVSKNKIKIFDESELKRSGAEFIKITGSIEGAMGHLEKRYKNLGKVTIEGQNFDPITKAVDRFTLKVEESEGVVKKLRFSLAELSDGQKIWINDKVTGSNKIADIEARNLKQMHEVRVATQQATEAERERTIEIKKQIELYKQQMLGGDGFKGELDIFTSKQKGRFDPKLLEKIRSDINGLNIETPDLNNKMKELNIQFSSLKQNASQSGSVMGRALENAGKFLRFYLVGGLLVGFVRDIREGINSIKELDASLTELGKVSDLTGYQLKIFTDRAYEVGRTIGRTGKEVIDATSTFKRAGYELESAFELSQQALLLTNIGDGINDVTEASSSLIAILKGFKMEAQSTAHIVDALNEVSNNYAVDTVNLTEILKRTSGTIGQTGTSYEQLLGLATGGYESLRNAEMVASGKMFCPCVQKCA